MSETPNIPPLEETTSDERTFGALAHALQLVGWWIAPLVIFIVKRKSRFVSFHALQALLLQLSLLLLWIGIMVFFFASIIGAAFKNGQPPVNAPPPGIFIFFPLIWLLMMGAWVLVLVLSITYAIKAGRGEWANYPLFGKLARYFLKM